MKIDFETLSDIAYQVDGGTYANYSGRSMYGKHCAGVVLDENDLIKLGAVIFEIVEDETLRYELLSNYTIDNLAQQVIVYWRGVVCEDAPEEDE